MLSEEHIGQEYVGIGRVVGPITLRTLNESTFSQEFRRSRNERARGEPDLQLGALTRQ